MNSIHDLGGMMGFGPVNPETGEPVFHAGWERRALAVTLAIGLMLFEAANQAAFVTGGADGLTGVSMSKVLGLFAFDLRGSTAYLYSLAVLFVLFAAARRLVASPFGLSLRGIRENVKRMPAIGAPVTRRLITIYTVSAAMLHAWSASISTPVRSTVSTCTSIATKSSPISKLTETAPTSRG